MRDLMEPKLQQEQDVRVHTITLSREGAESTAGVSVRDLMEPNQAPARAGCTSSYNYFVVTRETLPSEATAGVSVLDLMETNQAPARAGCTSSYIKRERELGLDRRETHLSSEIYSRVILILGLASKLGVSEQHS